jgi:EAL domain-containing protein (putative c-di-GMP-specific phosphodiesterase class I)
VKEASAAVALASAKDPGNASFEKEQGWRVVSEPKKAKFTNPTEVAPVRKSGTRPGVRSSEASGIRNVPPFHGTVEDGVFLPTIERHASRTIQRAELERTIRRTVNMSGLASGRPDYALDTGRPEGDDRTSLEGTLDRALDSLWMAYQPIVQAGSGSLFGYEALLRSGDPALPGPGAILDAAERLGRVDDVGRAVRCKASESMQGVRPPALLFINLHAVELNDETLTCPTAPLTMIASRVVLEITERASLEAIDDVPSRIAQLRELGFRIAIDDLGAGYSGLMSFTQLEPEFVKLDMSLVRDIHKNPLKQKLVRSMTALCKDMGITVVAEGIEVVEERDTIIELGCDLLQGFLLARPGRAFPRVRN